MEEGYHLLFDAYGCRNKANLKSVEEIKDMLLHVTAMIGLRPLSPTLIYEVDESMIRKSETGITGGIIFMESHFTFHAFPEKNYFSADVYSCKPFDAEAVFEYMSDLFEPKATQRQIIKRGELL